MSSLEVNKVMLLGNAGQDAEVKSTSVGKSVANFSFPPVCPMRRSGPIRLAGRFRFS
jgi:hypothetical protein